MNGNIKLILGFVLGILFTAVVIYSSAADFMITEYKCNSNFNSADSALKVNIIKQKDWGIKKVYNYDKTLKQVGKEDVKRMKIYSVCNPYYSADILDVDEFKEVSAIMPLRIAVYEKHDGEVYISLMNISLMRKLFSPFVSDIMAKAVKDIDNIILNTTQQK